MTRGKMKKPKKADLEKAFRLFYLFLRDRTFTLTESDTTFIDELAKQLPFKEPK